MFGLVQRIFGVSSAEDSSESTSSALINLPAGRLYLIRPKHTTKVEKECIYLEAELAVRRTADPFHYELVVERVTEEVREEEEEDVSSIEDDSQKAFLLDESLDFRVYDAIDESEDEETPTVAFSWLDHSSPDISERFEFLINIRHEGCSRTEIGHLESVVYQCIWERKNQKSSSDAPDDELRALEFKSRRSPSAATLPLPSSHTLRPTEYESDNSEVEDSVQGTSDAVTNEEQQDTEDGQSDSDAEEIVNQLRGTSLANNRNYELPSSVAFSLPSTEPSKTSNNLLGESNAIQSREATPAFSPESSVPVDSPVRSYEIPSARLPLPKSISNPKSQETVPSSLMSCDPAAVSSPLLKPINHLPIDPSLNNSSKKAALFSSPSSTPARPHNNSSVLSPHQQQGIPLKTEQTLRYSDAQSHDSSDQPSIYPTLPVGLSTQPSFPMERPTIETGIQDNDLSNLAASSVQNPATSLPSTDHQLKASAEPAAQASAPDLSSRVNNQSPLGETVSAWEGRCAVYVYDEITSQFKRQASNALASLWVSAPCNPNRDICWLIVGTEHGHTGELFHWVSTNLGNEQNLRFEDGAIRLNYIYAHPDTHEPITTSWALRFANDQSGDQYTAAQVAFTRAFYERDHGPGSYDQRGRSIQEPSYAHAREARSHEVEEDEIEGSEGSEEEDLESSDDDDNQVLQRFRAKSSGPQNSRLCVGTKEDVSFVLRGDMIGIFKNQASGTTKLPFMTNVPDLSTPGGERGLLPTKMMSHRQDTNIVLQDPFNLQSLYNLDLTVGKVVEEWKITRDASVVDFVPRTKFSQTLPEGTLLGASSNSIFTIDPRLSGYKAVSSESKDYKTKTDFTCTTTTQEGYIAVGSMTGDIRLYNAQIGSNAKTLLPGAGKPVLALDASQDGKYIIATFATYLMFIDCQIDADRGVLGFQKSFSKASPPQSTMLHLTPEHRAQILGEKIPFRFNAAKFNQGPGMTEKTIITSVGPYIIAFDMKKLKAGLTDYELRRYEDTIVADNFRWGNDKDIVVTMPSDVFMEKRARLSKPDRQSIVGGMNLNNNLSSKGSRASNTGRIRSGFTSTTAGIVEEWS